MEPAVKRPPVGRFYKLNQMIYINIHDVRLESQEPRIDFLVLNAGAPPPAKLEHLPTGFERNIGAFYFGHFYLFSLLQSRLIAQAGPCRVVSVAGKIHLHGRLDLADLHFEHGRKYSMTAAAMQVCISNFAKFVSREARHRVRPPKVSSDLVPGCPTLDHTQHVPVRSRSIKSPPTDESSAHHSAP